MIPPLLSLPDEILRYSIIAILPNRDPSLLSLLLVCPRLAALTRPVVFQRLDLNPLPNSRLSLLVSPDVLPKVAPFVKECSASAIPPLEDKNECPVHDKRDGDDSNGVDEEDKEESDFRFTLEDTHIRLRLLQTLLGQLLHLRSFSFDISVSFLARDTVADSSELQSILNNIASILNATTSSLGSSGSNIVDSKKFEGEDDFQHGLEQLVLILCRPLQAEIENTNFLPAFSSLLRSNLATLKSLDLRCLPSSLFQPGTLPGSESHSLSDSLTVTSLHLDTMVLDFSSFPALPSPPMLGSYLRHLVLRRIYRMSIPALLALVFYSKAIEELEIGLTWWMDAGDEWELPNSKILTEFTDSPTEIGDRKIQVRNKTYDLPVLPALRSLIISHPSGAGFLSSLPILFKLFEPSPIVRFGWSAPIQEPSHTYAMDRLADPKLWPNLKTLATSQFRVGWPPACQRDLRRAIMKRVRAEETGGGPSDRDNQGRLKETTGSANIEVEVLARRKKPSVQHDME